MQRNHPGGSSLNQIYQECRQRADEAFVVDLHAKIREHVIAELESKLRREVSLAKDEVKAKEEYGQYILQKYLRLQERMSELAKQNKALAAEIDGKTSDGECPRLTCATTRRKLATLRAKRKTDSDSDSS